MESTDKENIHTIKVGCPHCQNPLDDWSCDKECITTEDTKTDALVTVTFHDLEAGKGKVFIECSGQAWLSYWGAIGNKTITQFFSSCEEDYLADCFQSQLNTKRPAQVDFDYPYLLRIISAAKKVLVDNLVVQDQSLDQQEEDLVAPKTIVRSVPGLIITNVSGLDPVTVFFQDVEPGKGKVFIECCGRAWSAYWGSIGNFSADQFFALSENDILISSFIAPLKYDDFEIKESDVSYLAKIINAIKDALDDYLVDQDLTGEAEYLKKRIRFSDLEVCVA